MNVEGCAITDLLSDRDGLGDGINRGWVKNQLLLSQPVIIHDGYGCVVMLQFNVTSAAFDCVHSTGPAYFKDVCTLVVKIAGLSNLCLAICRDMFVSWKSLVDGAYMLQLQLSGTPYLLTSAQPLSLKDSLYMKNLKTNLFNQMYMASL